MEFNNTVPFPHFFLETNLVWGQCDDVNSLFIKCCLYLKESGITENNENISHFLKKCKNAAYMATGETFTTDGYQHDYANFGTRREHQNGTTTLWDYLVRKGVIEL